MVPAPRKAGAALTAANARGVLCTDAIGKFFGKTLRGELRQALVNENEPYRAHLGFSQIGNEDERKLWLQFRWCFPSLDETCEWNTTESKSL